ncbi:MAG: methyltransferase domain-containing protein [Planctomycetes bacterium]|nr:methyltransferase domain-containing protein [Planctomycetota bacterium]
MLGQQSLASGLVAIVLTGTATLPAAAQRVLHQETSSYNTILVTEDEKGLRTLWFEEGGARQSVVKLGDPDHLELPYAKAMLAGMALVENPKRVLVIGLGGGTIPNFLHKHYPETAIDVVDIDPAVVRVAKRFFGFTEDARLRAHVADGRKFIEECRKPYDVIFLDAFGAENVPYHLTTLEFLQAVRRALTPRGVALGNIWSRDANPLHDEMIRTYQAAFDELVVIQSIGAGNEILVALPRKERLEKARFVRLAARLARRRGFPYDVARTVAQGFHRPGPQYAQARVLTDANAIQP